MKTKIKNFIMLFLTIICLIVITETGCKKKKPAPAIPPQETFVMDMNFKNGDTTKSMTGSKDILTYYNWGHSAWNVAVWNFILTINMVIPVAAFLESFNHEAEYDAGDEEWTWSYNFTLGVVHTAKLKAKLDGEWVHWEMYISKENVFTDVLWFYGDSKTDGTQGTWTIKRDANNPIEYIGIIWHRNTDGTSDIKYTNIDNSDTDNVGADYGDYVMYGITTGAYDRFYDISILGNLTEIEWSYTSKIGRVKDFKRFQDNVWHCWDANLVDVACE